MKFGDFLAEDRRLCILTFLKDAGGTLNDRVLHNAIESVSGHRNLSRDVIRSDLRMMKDAGLIVDEWLGDYLVASITKRGVEVAEGRVEAEGIAQPAIGV